MWKRAEQYHEHPGRLEDLLRVGRRAVRVGLAARLGLRHGVPRQRQDGQRRSTRTIPPVVATHKGFALPGFDQRGAAPRDVGPGREGQPGRALHDLPLGLRHLRGGVRGGDTEGPYAGDDERQLVGPLGRLVHQVAAREQLGRVAASSSPARRSATCRTCGPSSARSGATTSANPNAAAHLLGKLITHVGPKRIAWGTDSLWYGSPQREIVALRTLQFTDEAKELYNLPYGLDGDVEDPTQPAPSPGADDPQRHPRPQRGARLQHRSGRAAQRARLRRRQRPAEVRLRRRTSASRPRRRRCVENQVHGARTRREVLKGLREGPWTP